MENKFTKIKYRVLQIAEHYRINKENFFHPGVYTWCNEL